MRRKPSLNRYLTKFEKSAMSDTNDQKTITLQQQWVFGLVLVLLLVVIALVGAMAWKTVQSSNELVKASLQAATIDEKVVDERISNLSNRINDIGVSAQIVGVGSGIFGVLLTVLVLYFQLNEKERIESRIQEITKKLTNDSEAAKTASKEAKTASEEAKTASEKAKTASEKAKSTADTAIETANKASTAAGEAKSTAEAAKAQVDRASAEAAQASHSAKAASEQAQTASIQASTASQSVAKAELAAEKAVTSANKAISDAKEALNQAELATKKAEVATSSVNKMDGAYVSADSFAEFVECLSQKLKESFPGNNLSVDSCWNPKIDSKIATKIEDQERNESTAKIDQLVQTKNPKQPPINPAS